MKLGFLTAAHLHHQEPYFVATLQIHRSSVPISYFPWATPSLLLAQGHKCTPVLGDNPVTGSLPKDAPMSTPEFSPSPHFLHILLNGDCHSKSLACLTPFYYQILTPQNWRKYHFENNTMQLTSRGLKISQWPHVVIMKLFEVFAQHLSLDLTLPSVCQKIPTQHSIGAHLTLGSQCVSLIKKLRELPHFPTPWFTLLPCRLL